MSHNPSIRIGTCSWAEKSLLDSGEFYPKGADSAEERLRFYAEHFDTVEVDSTYYAIPATRTTQLWADRTPEGFLFNVKVYGGLTGHGVGPNTLPKPLRELVPAEERDKARFYPTVELHKAIADVFVDSLQPIKAAGKLGLLVYQYPPWLWHKSSNFDMILKDRELIADLPMAMEFRHGSWLTEHHREQVFRFLRENGITYITADEPQYGSLATVPFLPEATTGMAYLRLHGRNKGTWLKKGVETSARYDYLYRAEELQLFAETARELSRKTKMTFIMFNNCHLGYAIRNALEMLNILR